MKYFDQGLYRHANCRDTAIEVMRCFYVVEKDLYKLKIHWWNIGAVHDPWPMGITQKIEIPGNQIRDWVRFSGRMPPVPSVIYGDFT